MQEFDFSELINYEPTAKTIKLEQELNYETVPQASTEDVIGNSPTNVQIETKVAPPVIFDLMLGKIKNFQSELNMDEIKGKSVEYFVCSVCYDIFIDTDALREHYVSVKNNLFCSGKWNYLSPTHFRFTIICPLNQRTKTMKMIAKKVKLQSLQLVKL